MNGRTFDELDDLGASVSPAAVRQWLAAERWTLVQANTGVAEIWGRGDNELASVRSVLLPLETTYVDFGRRFRSLLDDLQRAYQLSLGELVQEIASVSTDLFLVRLDQATVDGTIPFKQATSLLNSIQKMVRAAATSAANPEHSHTGRRPAVVTEFLEDELRFGHTKRGSFIITVAARLEPNPAPALPADAGVTAQEYDLGLPKPFSRQVMETLASGLAATKRHLVQDENVAAYEDFDSARVDGMSYELVQSLGRTPRAPTDSAATWLRSDDVRHSHHFS